MTAEPGRGVEGLGFLGLRVETPEAFEATVSMYRDALGLPIVLDEPGRAWFRATDGTPIHVYGPPEAEHEFFGAAPCVGLRVPDVPATRARLEAAGYEFVTDIERAGGVAWCHFRGPGGSVYELIGGG
jgi:catechol 2,3-dioxygenase-like lactoylglutathione lyase family enzyme